MSPSLPSPLISPLRCSFSDLIRATAAATAAQAKDHVDGISCHCLPRGGRSLVVLYRAVTRRAPVDEAVFEVCTMRRSSLSERIANRIVQQMMYKEFWCSVSNLPDLVIRLLENFQCQRWAFFCCMCRSKSVLPSIVHHFQSPLFILDYTGGRGGRCRFSREAPYNKHSPLPPYSPSPRESLKHIDSTNSL